ncbi:nitroimidazol reductase NimA-like FMN-containing flavoprotein (pyridoxamine 5'-phosphate oxidase superfamily)/plasmid maintenance system antidote protein VapI [Kitasatospora sp. GP30]|uniref:helix-turn-helix domain-containing protein n=1 Tax=Kitasatospora sp. GP30 TaxID=3035084 RepID=UPI000CB43DB7|nr:pyridoxamine 5'-phosphate oxidase family protein [Kitasatospora sp. GP30]MDH6144299.1 nitroimidazol reductase NimA-like FMN-containing flavoprotein (pyridoxamine 5'-phosphate oxidase superfamily)/plasmid maintenance system antidote protein VapI [Kitasatospora sp. GP30]
MSTEGTHKAQARPGHPGDVGRRVSHRRRQLGLSREEVAARAGIAVTYLEHLESQPDVVELETITKLADALGTSMWYLLGAGAPRPPGQAAPTSTPVLEDLEPSQCWAKVTPGGVGRIAVSTPDGPRVVPVNYHVLDETILYRTAAHGLPASAIGQQVAFEVDQLDEALSSGWSVVVAGIAEHLTDPEALEWLAEHADPGPWAGGTRQTWVRISPQRVTGRLIRTADLLP